MKKKSKYAEKRESGNMMYGPGCCAHTVQITDAVRERMHKRKKEIEREAKAQAERHAFLRRFGGLNE